ncbi:S-adenosylmethionine mitochondrial carrier protein homolog [Eupeodes corollae]|uniref:S-adenosylmethionine mitochondrial carrier protein homolog n=1 Tax=Eupeodes corollae TaxID=290404 RepID=UPI0024925809|nr:S-adenosylmethionine mitochondrial carrier protein homolog [Eupeodes corollae]
METESSTAITTDVKFYFFSTLISGAVAGAIVDVALFPIDTVKTRLQSENGFWRSGGFRGIYKGLAPAAAGSAPTAALFFCTYEGCKKYLSSATGHTNSPYIHMISASFAEVVACIIRVPVEIAKQRRQALSNRCERTALNILWTAYKTEGIRRGLYRGFGTTICREIPFSLIQFPLWEFLKHNWSDFTGLPLTPVSVAICGAIAGGISAAATTPLDVAKTRIMLADEVSGRKLGMRSVLRAVYKEKGFKGLISGILPRVMWITMGGAIFFGFYDLTSRILKFDRT